jgi:hypothetical protein
MSTKSSVRIQTSLRMGDDYKNIKMELRWEGLNCIQLGRDGVVKDACEHGTEPSCKNMGYFLNK